MSRRDETIGRMPNPTQFFLEWNSEKNSFCYYSKEKEERMPFPLPFKFLALKFAKTITGFDDTTKQGVYSNEVTTTSLEPFRVSRRDGSHVATGLYSDIKDQIKQAGGRFTSSIYAMSDKGVIINIRLTGSQMVNFKVIEQHGKRWQDEWIQVDRFETKTHTDKDEKTTNYSLPVFSFGSTLNGVDEKKAENAYKLIMDFFNSKPAYSSNSVSHQSQPSPAAPAQMPDTKPAFQHPAPDDDLPF